MTSAQRQDGAAVVQVPLVLLTGFLGSGKTTLLRELLNHPGMGETAVLINELGAVGLDQHLVWDVNETTQVLENGCVCCSIREDLLSTLRDLFWKRLTRAIPRFERVVIETTGVADPVPLLNALSTDALVAERFRIEAIITTVDATFGQMQLDRHREAVRQVIAADTLLLTKIDLAGAQQVAQLEQRLAQLNGLANIERIAHGKIDPLRLFGKERAPVRRPSATAGYGAVPVPRQGMRSSPSIMHSRHSSHDGNIESVAFRLGGALEREQLTRAMAQVLGRFGSHLLRVKGLVEIAGEEHHPIVVHAVYGVLFPFQALPAWPTGARDACLVFITDDLDAQTLLDALRSAFPGVPGKTDDMTADDAQS
jgi:G3E family GTPase